MPTFPFCCHLLADVLFYKTDSLPCCTAHVSYSMNLIFRVPWPTNQVLLHFQVKYFEHQQTVSRGQHDFSWLWKSMPLKILYIKIAFSNYNFYHIKMNCFFRSFESRIFFKALIQLIETFVWAFQSTHFIIRLICNQFPLRFSSFNDKINKSSELLFCDL